MHPHFRTTLLLFIALFLGQLIFALVATYLATGQFMEPTPILSFRFIVPGLLIGAATIVLILNAQNRQQAQHFENLEAKLQHYRQRLIIRLAILEGANLVAIVAALLTGHLNYLLLFLIGLGLFIYYRPRADEFRRDYDLTAQEEALFSGR